MSSSEFRFFPAPFRLLQLIPFVLFPTSFLLSMLEFLLLRPSIGFILLSLCIYAFYRWWISKPDLPDLPWVGLRKEWFAKIRCRWRTTVSYRDTLQSAYEKVCNKRLILVLTPVEVLTQGPALHPVSH